MNQAGNDVPINHFTAIRAHMAFRDFTLSNARRSYLSMENPLAVRGLTISGPFFTQTFLILHF